MTWVLLGVVVIIIGYFIYSRTSNSTHRLIDQEIKDHDYKPTDQDKKDIVVSLVAKQLKSIEEMIVGASTEGKSVPLALFLTRLEESKAEHHGDEIFNAVIDNTIKELIIKYGSHISPKEAYIESGDIVIWSNPPGCFERHLQRRYKSLLFPQERRVISKKEIEEARAKDKDDQEKFIIRMKEFISEVAHSESVTDNDGSAISQKVLSLLEETAALGGPLEQEIKILEDLQEQLVQMMVEKAPEVIESLKAIKALSYMARIPFMAQRKRQDTPILKNEELSALLSEELETIATIGYMSRSVPDFHPSDDDVRAHLDEALHQGFEIERAGEIWKSWIIKQGNL